MEDFVQDDDVRSMLGLAVLDEPPLNSGPAGVFDQARKIRFRQRIAFSASGVAAVAVVLAVAVAVGTGGPAGRSGPGLQAAGPGTAKPSTSAAATPPASPAAEIPADQMLARLKALLPAGLPTSQTQSQPGFAGVVVTDPAGKVTVEINVQPNFNGAPGPLIDDSPGRSDNAHGSTGPSVWDCAAWAKSAATTCTTATLMDGTFELTSDGPSIESSRVGMLERIVEIRTPSGTRILVAQWNATDTKRGAPTRSTQLLTLDQMKAIALNEVWLS